MVINFKGDLSIFDVGFYIESDGIEKMIIDGESININKSTSGIIKIYIKTNVGLSFRTKILLFIKRFVLNFFNILIMNFPINWYENIEPFIMEPIILRSGSDLEIQCIPSKVDDLLQKVEKRQILINNNAVPVDVKYSNDAIEKTFLIYAFDVISLMLYSFVLVSLLFVYSGKMSFPIITGIYIAIILSILILVIKKLLYVNKEKKKLKSFLEKT